MQEAIEVGYQVKAVHSQKVILTCSKLDRRLRRAIAHAHDAEEPGA